MSQSRSQSMSRRAGVGAAGNDARPRPQLHGGVRAVADVSEGRGDPHVVQGLRARRARRRRNVVPRAPVVRTGLRRAISRGGRRNAGRARRAARNASGCAATAAGHRSHARRRPDDRGAAQRAARRRRVHRRRRPRGHRHGPRVHQPRPRNPACPSSRAPASTCSRSIPKKSRP